MRTLLAVVCLSLVWAGCARIDDRHARVAAEDVSSFAAWQRHVAADFPPDLQQEFQEALQEIRYLITAAQEATGHDGIETALCKHVNARTVNEVLLAGEEAKLQRLNAERDTLQRAVNANAQLITRPDDLVAAHELERIRTKQQQRLDTLGREIQNVKSRMTANGGSVPGPPADAKTSEPLERLSREEGLRRIAVMIQERRDIGTLKYGSWPVKIDREGSELSETERRAFLERKAAAASEGRVVIPIKIKGHWLYFAGANQAPVLPKFVVANLTADDRRKFEEDWNDLEAELWARGPASDAIAAHADLSKLDPTGNP